MAISREKKKEIIAKISDVLKGSQSVVFVNFHGLSVSDSTAMRRKLRDEGAGFLVAKKTLVGKALDKTSVTGERPVLEGELGLAYSHDPIVSARAVYEFQKKFENRVAIMGGIFEGGYQNKVAMNEIAAIPSMSVLRGMFVNIINSPIQRLVIALDQIAQQKT